jgi:hypothetical protein
MPSLSMTLLLIAFWGSHLVSSAALPTIIAPSFAPMSHESEAEPLGQDNEITESNWRRHPKILAIRNTVQSVDAAVKKGILKTSQRRFEYCDEGFELLRRMAVNPKGVVRRYEVHGSFDDIPLTWQHYYDEAGVLRFVFIFGGPVNGKKIENRIYLDETGKRMWEDHRIEPEKVGLSAFLDQGVCSTDVTKAFADPSPCREIKPKSRHRTR